MANPLPGVQDKTKDEVRREPGWNVVTHNDPVNLMSYVVYVFRKVFGYDESRATRHMLEVHEKGRAVVWTGSKEQAELYAHQLHEYNLTASIEPADG